MRSRLLFAVSTLGLAVLASGCDQPEPALSPLEAAEAALVDGDYQGVLTQTAELASDDVEVAALRGRAALGAEQYQLAAQTAAPFESLADLLLEACVRGSLYQPPSVVSQPPSWIGWAECEASQAPIADALRAIPGPALDGELPLREIQALREATDALSVETRGQLEVQLRSMAALTSDVTETRWLMMAFEVALAPDLNDELLDRFVAHAEAAAAGNPHAAVTWYEHVYLPARVPGLVVSEELLASTQAAAHEALLPVLSAGFRSRYGRKHLDGDVESGRYNAETETFHFEGYEAGTRAAAVSDWMYDIFERPRPDVYPDFLSTVAACGDETQPCVVSFDVVARWNHQLGIMEAEHANALGVELTYPLVGAVVPDRPEAAEPVEDLDPDPDLDLDPGMAPEARMQDGSGDSVAPPVVPGAGGPTEPTEPEDTADTDHEG